MTTIKKPSSLKERRQLDKQKKKELEAKRTARNLGRDMKTLEEAIVKSNTEITEYVQSSLKEVKQTLSDSTDLFVNIINDVEKGVSSVIEPSSELSGLMSIFLRDVATLDDKRKTFLQRLTEGESNDGQSAIRFLTILYDDILQFAIDISALLIPQAERISELIKLHKTKTV